MREAGGAVAAASVSDSEVRARTAAGAGALGSVATMLTTCAVVALAASLAAAASDIDTVSADPNPNSLDANRTHGLNETLDAERYFIDKIFDKYGDRGVITFEVINIFYTFHNIFFSAMNTITYLILVVNYKMKLLYNKQVIAS